ncbi:AI-2E family transporter [bacterium]|nr:AI-2E family transporter [bacterium]
MANSSHTFSKDILARWFFLVLAGVVLYLFYRLVEPFLLTVLTAAMIAILVTPLEKWLRVRLHNRRISTVIVLLGVFLLLVGPLTAAGVLLVRQGSELVQWVLENPEHIQEIARGTHPFFSFLPVQVRELFTSFDLTSLAQTASEWARTHGARLFSSGAELVFKTFIFFICLYFFLSEREQILKEAMALSPLKDSLDKNITKRIVDTVRGVVFGSLIIAAIQSILAAIGFTIFGVPGAFIWAACVLIAAQVPMLGTSVIMIPAVLYLFITGETGSAIGLALWAGVAVGLVDNLLQPFIVGGRTHMHALLILLSILGGLEFFGPIGFILGPTILAALLVILEMYKGGYLER